MQGGAYTPHKRGTRIYIRVKVTQYSHHALAHAMLLGELVEVKWKELEDFHTNITKNKGACKICMGALP